MTLKAFDSLCTVGACRSLFDYDGLFALYMYLSFSLLQLSPVTIRMQVACTSRLFHLLTLIPQPPSPCRTQDLFDGFNDIYTEDRGGDG